MNGVTILNSAKNMIIGTVGGGMSFASLIQENNNYIITDTKNELKDSIIQCNNTTTS